MHDLGALEASADDRDDLTLTAVTTSLCKGGGAPRPVPLAFAPAGELEAAESPNVRTSRNVATSVPHFPHLKHVLLLASR